MGAEQVIVIGAGPAGLSVAACLKRQGVVARILEADAAVGPAWRRHYERLHLHTHKNGSALPGFAFPKAYPRFPSRDQVVRYLEDYAAHFQLSPTFGERVSRIEPSDDGWIVRTQTQAWAAPIVVVATGNTRLPFQPQWLEMNRFRGKILHAAAYRNGERWRGKRVLVVGAGNSGGEIAIDLCEHDAVPTLCVRRPVNVIPRQLFGIPILQIAGLLRWLAPRIADFVSKPLLRLALGNVAKLGFGKPPYGPLEQVAIEGRIPIIDVGMVALIREGRISVRPGIAHFVPDGVVFADGRHEPFDAVILATGYRPGIEEFMPLYEQLRGKPGLFWCGFSVSSRGMLKDIALEAGAIAHAVVRQLNTLQR